MGKNPSGDGALSPSDAGSNRSIRLKRELGLFSAVNMIVGVMIGSGIFISPTSALFHTGSVAFCIIIWILCGFVSLIGALSFAELGTVVPRSGAEYAYFQEAFGPLHPFWGPLPSFICSWIYIMILRPAEVAVLVLTFAEYTIVPVGVLFNFQHMTIEDQELIKKIVGVLTLYNVSWVPTRPRELAIRAQETTVRAPETPVRAPEPTAEP